MFPLFRDFDADGAPLLASASARTIAVGDLVIVYETPMSMKAVTVEAKGQFQNRFGSFQHRVRGGALGWGWGGGQPCTSGTRGMQVRAEGEG